MCIEIERQNPQTAASDELTWIHLSKKRVACCICMQNSRCFRESSNCTWLDKKQVVSQTNERNEMWQQTCVEWIPFIVTSKGRKKERSKKWRMKWLTSKFKTSANVSCVWSAWSTEKNGSMSVLGGAICRSFILSLVGRGLWHMQISATQNWYKRSNLSIVVVVFVASQ